MNRLKQIRLDMGMNSTEFAKHIGVWPSQLTRAESGKGMGVKTLAKVAHILEEPASTLLMPALTGEELRRLERDVPDYPSAA